MATPFNVCGGMQDNYDWCGPSQVRGVAGIGNHNWTTIQGGDGFVALQDPTDFRVVYSESQDGNMTRYDRVTGESMNIRPQAAPGEPPLRFQWDTPLAMSPHDTKVIYAPANKVLRSADRGLSWTVISPDLTSGANRDDIVTMGVKGSEIQISRNDGIAAWPAITTFAESPKRAGLLYAGTDDGHLQVSRDGKTWTDVIGKVPDCPRRSMSRGSFRRASTKPPSTPHSTAIVRTTSPPTSMRAAISARRGTPSTRTSRERSRER